MLFYDRFCRLWLRVFKNQERSLDKYSDNDTICNKVKLPIVENPVNRDQKRHVHRTKKSKKVSKNYLLLSSD